MRTFLRQTGPVWLSVSSGTNWHADCLQFPAAGRLIIAIIRLCTRAGASALLRAAASHAVALRRFFRTARVL